MANKSQSSFKRRQKEVARQTRLKEKQARRLDVKQKKAEAETDPAAAVTDEDPDLAGIVLGPQPRADEDDAGEGDEDVNPDNS